MKQPSFLNEIREKSNSTAPFCFLCVFLFPSQLCLNFFLGIFEVCINQMLPVYLSKRKMIKLG